ncbi:FAD dependent oxidoreductase [Cristinia sonorae]|uniref:FAD dependent oxidoreductase n=1 Tax=Cristinia sonorae TaxID=1940300 RepID=A0A8K0XQN6_9AGAR|nr:FAD dependent oxidoreductase [Cristinia sonorae]
MGNFVSRTKLVIGGAYILNKLLNSLSKRIKESPGLPVPNPTLSFWTVPKSKISSNGKAIPETADIVVIGSGITGTSFSYNALKLDGSLKIVILEARDVCSGATGRNGGHVNPPLYQDYKYLKETHGIDVAKKTIRFRLAHIKEFLTIAGLEEITEHSQCREVDNLDVYFTEDEYAEVKDALELWKTDMPEEAQSWEAVDGDVASKQFGLSSEIAGCVHGDGGAMHPYRFVTSLQSKLLERHSGFSIATHTPCTEIYPPSSSSSLYTLITPSGRITTPHIVHATNAWSSHLLTPMREKIIPVRGTMTAQRPGASLSTHTLDGLRSYVFNSGGAGYDYLTQLPTGEHELMFGGGALSNLTSGLEADLGSADDSQYSISTAAHITGSLPLMFGLDNWGKEMVPNLEPEADLGVQWSEGRVKSVWSGILGMSADGYPWVGRLPRKISGRPEPTASSTSASLPLLRHKTRPSTSSYEKLSDRQRTATPGEWIAAGYTGEGMVQAWMSAKALAYMVLDRESDIVGWFPENLRVTEERWKKADVVDLIIRRMT